MEKRNKEVLDIIRKNIKRYRNNLICEFVAEEKGMTKKVELKSQEGVDDQDNIEKYKTILTDLAIVRRAIENNCSSVVILGSAQATGHLYIETENILKEMGFQFNRNGCCTEVDLTVV